MAVTISTIRSSLRPAKLLLMGSAVAALAACTTVEGTNAFKDGETFEREVLTSTAQGIGLLPREKKEDVTSERAPLVLPKDAKVLPIPVKRTASAGLPEDSSKVQLDTSKLTDNEIRLLRGARVIDLNTAGREGRAFTPEEMAEVARRFREQREAYAKALKTGKNRPLFLPPERYFTKVNDVDLICLADNGDLVPLDSPLCPPEIKAALEGN